MIAFSALLAYGLSAGGNVSAAVVTAVIGEEIPLSGTASGADTVYLFLTGPNLPSNGVKLDDISREVISHDPDSFTRVTVVNGMWRYTWDTRTPGGTPDAGIYSIYAVRQPFGRNDLQGADYSRITIQLTTGGLDAAIGETGEISVNSRPPGAEVFLDGDFQGTTPLVITDVPTGNHTVSLKKEGYSSFTRMVEVERGSSLSITGDLSPLEPTVPGTPVSEEPTPAPTSAAMPFFVILAALVLGGLAISRKKP